MSSYRVNLQSFAGPFDLLLFLIRKNEIDIYDIPISELIEQYLNYLDIIREIDLDNAAEFIVMAATLMQIKARLLLPGHKTGSDDVIEDDDPRADLVRQLLTYRQFREAAGDLENAENAQQSRYPRSYFPEKKALMNTAPDTAEKYLKDVTLFDLLVAFQKAVADMPKITKHVVEKHDITIEEQEQFIRLQLRQKPSRTFMQLLKGVKQRIVAVVTLLAILEMVRNGEIRIRQKSVFGQVQMELAGGK